MASTWIGLGGSGGSNGASSGPAARQLLTLIDYSTAANQNLATGGDGAKTIDGKAAYLIGSANATANVTNGSGIVLVSQTGTNKQAAVRLRLGDLAPAIANYGWDRTFILDVYHDMSGYNVASVGAGGGCAVGIPTTPSTDIGPTAHGIQSHVLGYTSTDKFKGRAVHYRNQSTYLSPPAQWASNNVDNVHRYILRTAQDWSVETAISTGGAWPAESAFSQYFAARFGQNAASGSGYNSTYDELAPNPEDVYLFFYVASGTSGPAVTGTLRAVRLYVQ